MKTLIVSDIHIGRNDSECEKCLDVIKNNPTDEIILNGDIFDQFAIWKDKGKLYKERHLRFVKEFMKIKKERKTKVYYLIGNHDYLAFLLIPFGFLFGIKFRKRVRKEDIIIEHGDWITLYLKIKRLFNKKIEISDDTHENYYTFSKIKNKKFIVGHTHEPRIISNKVYDEGDWVGSNTYLIMEDRDIKIIVP